MRRAVAGGRAGVFDFRVRVDNRAEYGKITLGVTKHPRGCFMRKWALLGLIAGAFIASAGCNGVVKNYDERMNIYGQVLDMDTRQLVDDWDRLWLADRQYRLTRWQLR